MIILLIVSCSIFLLFFIIWIIFILHWNKTEVFRCPVEYIPSTKVSILLPVRNEASNILDCLESLVKQNYPAELLEIIVVDDQSYDETPDILEHFSHPLVKSMRLGVERRTTIEGSKKKAIAYGVSHAKGELIITTDGDCNLPINWVRNITAFYRKTNAKLIVGPVILKKSMGWFESFQNLDMMSTFLVQTAGISSRLFYLCSGANLAYEKEAFLQANPYESNMHVSSGDDVFLIQKFKQLYKDQIKVCKSKDIICHTNAATTISEFMSQRLRWSGKMKKVSNFSSLFIASLLWLLKILPYVVLAISICTKNMQGILVASSILLMSFILDFILLYLATGFFKQRKKLWWFLPAEFIYTIYYILLGILSWFPLSLEWKDRKISV
ncbi:MAG: glycosyltransferase [Saprospiraceae bacterium]